MDFSTIDLDVLRKLPLHRKPPTYRYQRGSGNGCYGDPPGYPTYFTRNVYTRHGNNPGRGATLVVTEPAGSAVDHQTGLVIEDPLGLSRVVMTGFGDDDYQKRDELFKRLWKPLPLDHERTRLWIVGTHQRLRHCYADAERLEHGRPGTLIFPVPSWQLKSFADDPRWNDEYRAAAKAEVEAHNRQETERAARIATPDNHRAVLAIRRFYPDYRLEPGLIADPPKDGAGSWWETEAAQPSEADCAGTQRWGNKHPFNGAWCQWCGRRYPSLQGENDARQDAVAAGAA